ncbi:hypothetical protein J6590_055058 [Homalodisca vitripennis]|nr:hypothetical protein J6590_055058 [Homalodisca vitripennis]
MAIVPQKVLCGVCGAVRYYRYLKQTRECIIPQYSKDPLSGVVSPRCKACWLKMCLRGYCMPKDLKTRLTERLPLFMRCDIPSHSETKPKKNPVAVEADIKLRHYARLNSSNIPGNVGDKIIETQIILAKSIRRQAEALARKETKQEMSKNYRRNKLLNDVVIYAVKFLRQVKKDAKGRHSPVKELAASVMPTPQPTSPSVTADNIIDTAGPLDPCSEKLTGACCHSSLDKPFTLFYKKTAASDLEEFNELSMKSTRASKIPAILLNLLPVPIEKRPPVAELCTSNLPWVFITLRHDGQHDEERANIEEAEQGEGQTEQEEDQIEDHNYDTDDES